MFALIDTHATDTIEWIRAHYSEPMDSGHMPPEIAVVSLSSNDSVMKAQNRALIERARDAASEGYYAPQDRAIRCGVRIAGDGAILVTLRHLGEHVVVWVGVIDAGIITQSDTPAFLSTTAAESRWIRLQEEHRSQAERFRKLARRIARQSRLVSFGNRKAKAWRVPGTEEAGRYDMLIENARRCDRDAFACATGAQQCRVRFAEIARAQIGGAA